MQRDACSYGCCCCCCCSGLLAVFRDAGCIHACSFPDAAMHSPEQVASMLAVFRDAACCLQQAASSMLVGCNHPCCLGCIGCIRCIHSPEQHAAWVASVASVASIHRNAAQFRMLQQQQEVCRNAEKKIKLIKFIMTIS